MKTLALLVAGGLVLFSACTRGAKLENEPAVRQALERYLASRPNLNMQGMKLQIGGMQFRGQQARVDVVFQAKSGGESPGGSMSMRYTLNRRGDRWEVEPQSSAHGGMTPPAGSGAPEEMPPGHPAVKKP